MRGKHLKGFFIRARVLLNHPLCSFAPRGELQYISGTAGASAALMWLYFLKCRGGVGGWGEESKGRFNSHGDECFSYS